MPTRSRARLLALPLATILSTSTLAVTGVLPGTSTSADAADRLTRREEKIFRAVRIARRQIGDPYRYGAAGPGAFDCSGLTQFAYRKAGFRMPRTTDAQYSRVRHIKKRKLRRGDFVFFHNGGDVYHVGIFLKWRDRHRIILHSPYPGRKVHRERIWTRHWRAGTLRRPKR